jgi:serine/threonine protein kinase
MKKGESINGYIVTKDSTMVGGGMCTWTFAKKSDKDFFLKEFLFPVYPTTDSPGSSKMKHQRRQQCENFESYQKKIIDTIKSKCSTGGNLIFAHDFFRFGSKYYKVTEKVDIASITLAEIAELELRKRLLIMTTVSHSVKILHDLNIVHGDLKPDNILIKKIESGLKKDKGAYTTKLIDFDNSFFSENPPEISEELVGDMAYYSPELYRYIKINKLEDDFELTVQSDIFALGLIFSKYLSNSIPKFDKDKYKLPSVAVSNGESLTLISGLYPTKLESLINSMLLAKHSERPNISTVHSILKELLHSAEVSSWTIKSSKEIISTSSIKSSGDSKKKSKVRLSSRLSSSEMPTLFEKLEKDTDPSKMNESRLRISKNLKK